MEPGEEKDNQKKIVVVEHNSEDESSRPQLNAQERNDGRKSKSKLSICVQSHLTESMESGSSAGDSEVESPPNENTKKKHSKTMEQPAMTCERGKPEYVIAPNIPLHEPSYHSAKMKKSAVDDMASSTEEDIPHVYDNRKVDFPVKSKRRQDGDDSSSDETYSDQAEIIPHSGSCTSKQFSDHKSILIHSLILHNKSRESGMKDNGSIGKEIDPDAIEREKSKLTPFVGSDSHDRLKDPRKSLLKTVSVSINEKTSMTTAFDADLNTLRSWSSRMFKQRPSIVMRMSVEKQPSFRGSKVDKPPASTKTSMATDAEYHPENEEKLKQEPCKAEKEKKDKMEVEKKESKKCDKRPSKEDKEKDKERRGSRLSFLLRNEQGMKPKEHKPSESRRTTRPSLLLINQAIEKEERKRASVSSEKRPSSTPERGRVSSILMRLSQKKSSDAAKNAPRPSLLLRNQCKSLDEGTSKPRASKSDKAERRCTGKDPGKDNKEERPYTN